MSDLLGAHQITVHKFTGYMFMLRNAYDLFVFSPHLENVLHLTWGRGDKNYESVQLGEMTGCSKAKEEASSLYLEVL